MVPETGRVPVVRSRRHVLLEYLGKLDWVGAQEGHWSVHGQPAASSGRSAVPHVCAHVDLQRETEQGGIQRGGRRRRRGRARRGMKISDVYKLAHKSCT